jgi:hypothetical protein
MADLNAFRPVFAHLPSPCALVALSSWSRVLVGPPPSISLSVSSFLVSGSFIGPEPRTKGRQGVAIKTPVFVRSTQGGQGRV